MVEWKKLGEICTNIFAGGTPSTGHDDYYDGEIPWIRSGEIDFNVIKTAERNITKEGLKNSSAKMIRANSVVMAMTGATVAKTAVVEFPTASNQSVCALENDEKKSNYKYIYYWLSHNYFKIKSSAQGALTSLNLAMIKQIEIPLLPLSEQLKIVDNLDFFTRSIDNLRRQIELRKKQFEYYCNQYYGGDFEGMIALSNYLENSVVPFERLGTITRGRRFVREDVRESGQPCIHYGDMYTYYGTKAYQANTFLDIDFPKKMRYAKKGDVVIVGAGENDYDIGVGVVWMGDEPAAVHDACYILEHKQNPMYISYYLRSNIYHQQLKKYVSSGKISSFSAEGLGKVLIPIQSEAKQKEIVSNLEMFETSISKLEQMVALRQKQYEYYREKLLSFE